jgi:hypothetical protein
MPVTSQPMMTDWMVSVPYAPARPVAAERGRHPGW